MPNSWSGSVVDLSTELSILLTRNSDTNDTSVVVGAHRLPVDGLELSEDERVPPITLWIKDGHWYQRGHVRIPSPMPHRVASFEEALTQSNINDVRIWSFALLAQRAAKRHIRVNQRVLMYLRRWGDQLLNRRSSVLKERITARARIVYEPAEYEFSAALPGFLRDTVLSLEEELEHHLPELLLSVE